MTGLDLLATTFPKLDAVKMQLLVAVDCHQGCSVSDVAKRCFIKNKTAQFHIKTMGEGLKSRPQVAMGLIECIPSEVDRRKCKLHLTERGRFAVTLIKPLAEKGFNNEP